jgi:hypothetical protein
MEFSNSYVEKCLQYSDDIDYLIGRSRGLFAGKSIETPRYYFRVGDYFHCPELMDPFDVKEAKTINQYSISAGIPSEEYPTDKCIYIPTEDQLAEGLKACNLSMGLDAHGQGPEILLERYIEFLNQDNN